MDVILGIGIGVVLAGAIGVAVWRRRPASAASGGVDVRQTMMKLYEVGELIVYHIHLEQLVTKTSHPLGGVGEYLTWIVSHKRIAVIFTFGIDIKYNLRDPAFRIEPDEGGGPGCFKLVLPPPSISPHILDIRIQDEENSRLLPLLLGDITKTIGPGFGPEEKTKLLAEARVQSELTARQMNAKLQTQVQNAARQTLETIARGFGAKQISVAFADGDKATIEAPKSPASLPG